MTIYTYLMYHLMFKRYKLHTNFIIDDDIKNLLKDILNDGNESSEINYKVSQNQNEIECLYGIL